MRPRAKARRWVAFIADFFSELVWTGIGAGIKRLYRTLRGDSEPERDDSPINEDRYPYGAPPS
jgi:hypothetical protein